MNVKQLETFVWIVRLGSFAAAANHLHATQSTVSFRIQELEQHLDVALFDRRHHRARLTAKGKELVPYAEQLLKLVSETRQRIGDQKALAGVGRVGVAEVVAKTWLPNLVTTTIERHPKVTLEIEVGLTNALITKLRAGDLDLALIPGPVTEPNLMSRALGQVAFAWMASSRLRIPKRALAPTDLLKWPILSLSQDSHHYYTIEAWFAASGTPYSPAISSNNMDALGDLTVGGSGVSHLPVCCYQAEIRAHRLVILRTTPPMPGVEFFAVAPRGRFQPVSYALMALAEEVSDFPRD